MGWKNFTWDLGHCTFPDTFLNFGVGGVPVGSIAQVES